MIAYSKIWLTNQRLQNILQADLRANRINGEEYKAITEKSPVGFYSPGIGARVGLFILTSIIVLFSDGLLSLICSPFVESGGWYIFLGFCSYGAAEMIIISKHHLRSGVDDALVLFSALTITIGFAFLFSGGVAESYLLLSLSLAIVTLLLAARFMDMLMAAVCCGACFSVIYFVLQKAGAGFAIASFVLMAAAAGGYWFLMSIRPVARLLNYSNCLAAGRVICLLVFYASGNFYVVQSLHEEISGSLKTIQLAPFFWLWTIAIPFVYLWLGIKYRDIMRIRLSLLLMISAGLTWHNYHHLMPVEVLMTIVGAIMLTVGYAVTRYLKTPKHGFTLKEADTVEDRVNVESLIIAQTFAGTATAKAGGVKFGGGDFGGGGSSGGF